MSARDRDGSGRPRNGRPRDALGRVLPPGSVGEPRIPDDLALSPDQFLSYAQELIDHDRPFHAHEVLEAAWKSRPQHERPLWQGLAQLAVGVTHVHRGNPAGAVALLRRGADHLRGLAGAPPWQVDVEGLCGWAGALADDLDGGAAVAPTRLRPALTTVARR
ncbi:hypothetical protein MMAD_38710 [Mycolicibacterium madagascariense]|uniref:DUF309 domain-containing protein n=1 Tax=Mycolicibacterium madagascariense TaxID=212765 RepID=A0A7I7XK66_9MYCO|nr:DUF309 domain-containing protein [Mycolicibacterium madagascariense]MCV7011224.1 DUF309 domain-containing protein [Mycolicibacterium madagascariense]BBZ29576.1 hypothetical protein MMAD_38710 [Mycolicibacterium madagascariense]